jgi:hypothetical protein
MCSARSQAVADCGASCGFALPGAYANEVRAVSDLARITLVFWTYPRLCLLVDLTSCLYQRVLNTLLLDSCELGSALLCFM